MNVEEYFGRLCVYAPLSLSEDFVKAGAFDNSGLIVKTHDEVNKVLFALDLTENVVDYAVKNGFDTVVTHHPAIYKPVSDLTVDGGNSAVTNAGEGGLNVISMHRDLDVTEGGVDDVLAEKLGGEKARTVTEISGKLGYGKECEIKETTFKKFVENARNNLCFERFSVYGDEEEKVSSFASFCGGGSGDAVNYALSGGKADVVVTSDMRHHEIVALLSKKKKILLITHYASEI
ncbi:MAG: Nif3-like dinuclear metal center hexameric protein, partial [Clostridia bacterium]|nr:Nif3-like dinuclear metal center hexameric protein [Clostridia bacterium]